jgi:hypothetical protein
MFSSCPNNSATFKRSVCPVLNATYLCGFSRYFNNGAGLNFLRAMGYLQVRQELIHGEERKLDILVNDRLDA